MHDILRSDDERYQYRLIETGTGVERILFIGLNPSNKGSIESNATLTRLRKLAGSSYGKLVVVNLYAWRSAFPQALKGIADPCGPLNYSILREEIRKADKIVGFWGQPGPFQWVADGVVVLAQALGKEVMCLGTNKDGCPKHPLRMSNDVPLRPL